jgi:serine/threonine-protein kinase
MELLEGLDLAALWFGQDLTLERRLTLMRKLCTAVAAIHDAGIVHRDLKPENIFVTTCLGEDSVKVLDFGVARLPDGSARALEGAETGTLRGTPEYMAPEQASCRETDHRADIYAVGAILF